MEPEVGSQTIHLRQPQINNESLLVIAVNGSVEVKQRVVKHRVSANEGEIEVVVNTNYDEDEETHMCNHIAINEDSDGESSENEVQEAPPQLEDGVQSTADELKVLNLGTPEKPRPILVSSLLSSEEEQSYVEILREYRDVFAWTYKEMSGLDPKVAIITLV